MYKGKSLVIEETQTFSLLFFYVFAPCSKQFTLSSFVSIYYASLMKRVETNDNQVLSIMVKSCCFTELSMKLDSCNLLLIPQNTVTPHSSEKRESIVSV